MTAELDLIGAPLGAYGDVYEHYDADRKPRRRRAARPGSRTHTTGQRPPRAGTDVLLRRAHQLLPAAVGDADVRRVGGRRERRGRPGYRLPHSGPPAGGGWPAPGPPPL